MVNHFADRQRSCYLFFYMHERDHRIADKVYQQLLSIDIQLDQLQESATVIKAEKETNSDLCLRV